MKKIFKYILSALVVLGVLVGCSSTKPDDLIDVNGTYTSKEEVSLYIHTYGELPDNYITKDEARCPKTGKYGVEYASPEAILRALKAAKAEQQEYEVIYELNDLVQWGLAGLPDSAVRRKNLCEQLSIGECNAKQLVKKLNSYQISREEIEKLL